MKMLLRRLARDAAAPIEQMGARLVRTAALFFLAASCLLLATVFLTFDLYFYLQTLTGTLIAALGIGGLYLGFALIFLALAMRHAQPVNQPAGAAPLKAAEPLVEPNPEFAGNIDDVITPILAILSKEGFKRERLAVETGAAIAKQVNPFVLVAIALIAGIMFGRRPGQGLGNDGDGGKSSNESPIG